MVKIAEGRCAKCGKKRIAGWVLVEGHCVECKPEAFERRKAELAKQAAELLRAR